MKTIHHASLMLTLAAALVFASAAQAEDAAPVAPASEAAVTAAEQAAQDGMVPMLMPGMAMGPGMGLGPGLGMRRGAMHAEGCHHGGKMDDDKPCMTMGQHKNCRMGDGAGMADKRLDMLEKRMDMMQMMLEMLTKQQGASSH